MKKSAVKKTIPSVPAQPVVEECHRQQFKMLIAQVPVSIRQGASETIALLSQYLGLQEDLTSDRRGAHWDAWRATNIKYFIQARGEAPQEVTLEQVSKFLGKPQATLELYFRKYGDLSFTLPDEHGNPGIWAAFKTRGGLRSTKPGVNIRVAPNSVNSAAADPTRY